ncbi:MAG: hypothetical protein ACRCXD_05640 [Luteolibacter sp.]
MRVPIPWVILLALAVVAGVWLANTRHMDFLTPPSEAHLESIRIKAESSLPQADPLDHAISEPAVIQPLEPPPLPVENPVPAIDLGDLQAPLTLQLYGERSANGSDHLIELATALEEASEPQRALLAWERVLDLTRPDESQSSVAISSIKRLRATLPDWNQKPEAAIAITLHASTGKKFAKAIPPVLEAVARDLEKSSSGIVKVKPLVTLGQTNRSGTNPAPVALWLAGPDKKATTTEVVSFKVDSAENLRHEVLKSVFQLIQTHLDRHTAYTPPAALTEVEDPLNALNSRVTRLSWSEFATALNQPQKTPAKP